MLIMLAMIGDEEKAGYNTVKGFARTDKSTGLNNFTPDLNGNHQYVIKKFDDSYYANHIDEIIA
jgi:hypothetical protein